MNSSFNLGKKKKITVSKTITNNLRYLPVRFQPKVTMIEKSKDVDMPKLNKSVGNLQTHEANHDKIKRSIGIALSSQHLKDLKDDSDSKSENDLEMAENSLRNIRNTSSKKNSKLLYIF